MIVLQFDALRLREVGGELKKRLILDKRMCSKQCGLQVPPPRLSFFGELVLTTVDLSIVGNGILGLMTAFELTNKEPNLKIAVIGPADRKGGASQASGAMLGCFGEITDQTFFNDQAEKRFLMAYDAHKRWPSVIENLNSLVPKAQQQEINQGTFVVLNPCSGQIESDSFRELLAALKRFDEPYEEIDPRDIEGFNPNENLRPLRSIVISNEGSLDSRRFMSVVRSLLEQRGVQFVEQKALGFHQEGAGFVVDLENSETVQSSKCLLAAGAFTQDLLDAHPDLADRIPHLFPGVGFAANIEQVPDNPIRKVVRTPNRAGACGLHVVPQNDGSLYLGASNDVYLRPQTLPMTGIVHFLLECGIEQINPTLYRSNLLQTRTGNRPVTADGFPLVGETSIEGLYILGGTYRDGFHKSPVLAEAMAEEILGEEPTWQHDYQPERSLIPTVNKEESLKVYLDHLIAASYEHGWRAPKISSQGAMRQMQEEKIRKFYDTHGFDFGISAEILLMHELDSKPDEALPLLKKLFCKKESLTPVS